MENVARGVVVNVSMVIAIMKYIFIELTLVARVVTVTNTEYHHPDISHGCRKS